MDPNDVDYRVSTRSKERLQTIHDNSLFKAYLKATNNNYTYNYYSSEYETESDDYTETE